MVDKIKLETDTENYLQSIVNCGKKYLNFKAFKTKLLSGNHLKSFLPSDSMADANLLNSNSVRLIDLMLSTDKKWNNYIV